MSQQAESNASDESSERRRYRPPRSNAVAHSILETRPVSAAERELAGGIDVGRLRTVAMALATTEDEVRTLVGLLPPEVERLRQLVARWASDGTLEQLDVQAPLMRLLAAPDPQRTTVSTDALQGPFLMLVPPLVEALSNDERAPPSVAGAAADRLLELEDLIALALAVLQRPDAVNRWFGASLIALGNRSPRALLSSAPGRERVRELLHAIEYGFAA